MNNLNPEKQLISGDCDQEPRWAVTEGIQVDELAQQDMLSITTANSTYEMTVIDPETAQVMVRGGNYFRSDTLAHVSSSSSFMKPYGIYVGYAIEFSALTRFIKTSPVRTIRVLKESERAA
jgi:hypothetical protein